MHWTIEALEERTLLSAMGGEGAVQLDAASAIPGGTVDGETNELAIAPAAVTNNMAPVLQDSSSPTLGFIPEGASDPAGMPITDIVVDGSITDLNVPESVTFQEGLTTTGAVTIRQWDIATFSFDDDVNQDGSNQVIIGFNEPSGNRNDRELLRGLFEFDLSTLVTQIGGQPFNVEGATLVLNRVVTGNGDTRQGAGNNQPIMTLEARLYDSDFNEAFATWADPSKLTATTNGGDTTAGGTLSTVLSTAAFDVEASLVDLPDVTFADSSAFRTAINGVLGGGDTLRLLVRAIDAIETESNNPLGFDSHFARFASEGFVVNGSNPVPQSQRPKLEVSLSAPEAIAVTGVDDTNGTWQYSTDGGTNWLAFSGPAPAAARLLGPTEQVRFVPNTGFFGTSMFTFRAWDQTTGTAGGTADTTNVGGATAFSMTSDTASITVNPPRDFGDAPTAAQTVLASGYPTLAADNGAAHTIGPLFLGATVDDDPDGQPEANSLGDDNDGGNDEDGVVFNDIMEVGGTATITVTASQAGGVLNAWVDWNQNGSWLDAGEQVFTDEALVAGANSLNIAVPAGASLGLTYSRFRLSTETGLAPTGLTADGEVEDYKFTVQTAQNRINWVNRGQASDLFDSTFGAAVNLARGVVDAVITSWERVIDNFNQPFGGDQINVTISMESTGTGFGGGVTSISHISGFPTAGTLILDRGKDTNSDGLGDGDGFFLDPTPLDNSEFAGALDEGAFVGNAQAGSPAQGLRDFFTLVNAEITHVMGLMVSPTLANNPLNGTIVPTGVIDDSEGGGTGTYRVFDGPSVTHLFTSNNGGPAAKGGSDLMQLIHSAGPPPMGGGNQPHAFTSTTRGSLQLVGANGPGNAGYEISRRYLVNDVIPLFFKDAYEYSITSPQTFGTTYAMLNQNTGDLLIRGGLGGSTDVISVSLNGSDVEVSVNIGNDIAGTGPNGDASDIAAFVSRFPLSSVSSITIQAGDGDDQFSIAPLAGVPITIDGGTPAFPNGGVGDLLTIDIAGVGGMSFADNGNGSGSLTSSNRSTLTWSEIERFTPLAWMNAGDINRAGSRELTFLFPQAVTVASAGSLNLFNHTTGQTVSLTSATLLNNGTAAVTWDLTGVALPDGRYTAELPATATTPNLAQTRTLEFFQLAGDVDGDGFVNFNDFFAVDASFNTFGNGFLPGDADGDGFVNFNDFFNVDLNFNTFAAATSLDFGDAPDSATFPTTLANDGARHVITGNTLFLGTFRDGETDGQSSVDATGDDVSNQADEDGIAVGNLDTGTSVPVTVTANVPVNAVLNGWIDFNQDGDWDDPGEQVFTDQMLVDGANNLTIAVPLGAMTGTTFARFRITETAGYSYFGLAPNGEVEDYQLTVTNPPLPTTAPQTSPAELLASASLPSLTTPVLGVPASGTPLTGILRANIFSRLSLFSTAIAFPAPTIAFPAASVEPPVVENSFATSMTGTMAASAVRPASSTATGLLGMGQSGGLGRSTIQSGGIVPHRHRSSSRRG